MMMGTARSVSAVSLEGIRVAGVGTSSVGKPIIVPPGSRCLSRTRKTSCAQRHCSMSLRLSSEGKVRYRPSVVGQGAVEGGAVADVDVEEVDVMEVDEGWVGGDTGEGILSGIGIEAGLGNDRLGVGIGN